MKTKQRKSIISKFMAFCLACVLVLSMSMTAFAADITADTKSTITVTGTAEDVGATIKAYKLINVNYDYANAQLEEPVYTWTETMAGWLEVNETYKNYINAADDTVTETYMGLTAGELNAFYKAVVEANILTTPDATGTIAADGGAYKATLADVGMGSYLVTATPAAGKTATYQPMQAEIMPDFSGDDVTLTTANVVLKGSLAPEITKEGETKEGDQTVSVGDTVTYTITADIPSYPEDATAKSFVVGDKLSTGLTLDDNSIRVKIGETELTKDTHYFYTDKSDAEDDGFELEFIYSKLKEDYSGATEVTVTYTATVNNQAFATDALGNKAFLGYNTNPYDSSSYDTDTTIEEEVYTYGLTLIKKDKNKTTALSGVEFQLKDADETVMKFTKVGDTYIYDPTNGDVENLTTDTDGKISLGGVDAGTYKLVETKAHNGYVLPKGEITVTLTDADPDPDGELDNSSTVSYTGGDLMTVNSTVSENVMTINITNTSSDDAGFNLPTTGGMGTAIFTIAGIILMAGAVTMVVVISRKKRA